MSSSQPELAQQSNARVAPNASQEVVNTQPAAALSMSLKPEDDETRASRLRGGCFPLPVSLNNAMRR
jgi:hypothetical protein